jgi:hypothetical protein
MVTFNRDGNIFVEDTGMDSFIRSGNCSAFSCADATTLTGLENVRIDSNGIYIDGMGTITSVVNALKEKIDMLNAEVQGIKAGRTGQNLRGTFHCRYELITELNIGKG